MSASRPLYPQKQTSELGREMPALCQKQTFCTARKQTSVLTLPSSLAKSRVSGRFAVARLTQGISAQVLLSPLVGRDLGNA